MLNFWGQKKKNMINSSTKCLDFCKNCNPHSSYHTTAVGECLVDIWFAEICQLTMCDFGSQSMLSKSTRLLYGSTASCRSIQSSLNCTLLSCRLEMVRSPQFNLFLFSKMIRCNLKTCSYFGEVDNMQMICECTHENILKQWGKSFSKQLEMPSTYRYQGPKQTKFYENRSLHSH